MSYDVLGTSKPVVKTVVKTSVECVVVASVYGSLENKCFNNEETRGKIIKLTGHICRV
jgi:hypothetical protein